MANILDLDEILDGKVSLELTDELALAEEEALALQKVKARKQQKKEQQFFSLDSNLGKDDIKRSKDVPFDVDTVQASVSKNAKKKLELFLKKTPQYKVLSQQIKLLTDELVIYKKAGEKDFQEKTKQLIIDLSQNRNKFVKMFKSNADWKKEKDERYDKIQNSEVLKDLKLKRTELEKEFRLLNPNSIIFKLKELREALNLVDKHDYENDFKDDDVLDFDDVVDNNMKGITLEQEYNNFCGYIADMVFLTINEVKEANYATLSNLLKQYCDDEKIDAISNELTQIKLKVSMQMSEISGKNDITNLMFEIFDFQVVEESQPKEILAASNVEYVKGIAFNTCRRLNMLHFIDDAVGYGLVGLSLAINCWYKIQKIQDSPISFNGFAHQYVVNNIQKGLYELGSGGQISKNSLATMVYYRKQQFTNFLKNNPELQDMPSEVIESIIEGLGESKPIPKGVYTESEINERITGGEQDGDSDMWLNTHASDIFDDKFAEAKNEYENLLKSLKQLFQLFETKTDKITGVKEVGYRKIFDKYDYKLFKLTYGLEFKRDSVNETSSSAKTEYTQEEIRIIMQNYQRADGNTALTLTQPAISDRKKRLDKKIKEALDDNPGLKAGLQSIMYYCAANRSVMNTLSNTREEVDISNDRKELAEIYSDNKNQMNKVLLDGKRLSDVYQISNVNPFDDEISQTLRNF